MAGRYGAVTDRRELTIWPGCRVLLIPTQPFADHETASLVGTAHPRLRRRPFWTKPAVRDLAAARDHIAHDNAPAADRQVERVLAAIQRLLQFSEIGRSGCRAGTRELVINGTPYIAAYRVAIDAIEVLRVTHGRQRCQTRSESDRVVRAYGSRPSCRAAAPTPRRRRHDLVGRRYITPSPSTAGC